MIEKYFIICATAFLTSGLTLFSGFGLGTLLLPVMAIFFPLELAIALTGAVHLLNNFFKLALLGKYADKDIIWRFGAPAILSAYLGAKALVWLSHLQPLLVYAWWGKSFQVMPVKLVVAVLMTAFALWELNPRGEKLSVDKKFLPVGGLLSGFFGGLSGHQGALRSIFLIRAGLTKEGFIATGVVIACLVDFSRLSVYASRFSLTGAGDGWSLLAAATLSAFLGAYLGNRLLKKATLRFIQILVSIMLLAISLALAMGLI